ncbi:MAG: amino-acid N-acetyltransferase [Verrucomicrobiota bacterium]|nr:amino-acid N-acetyltransferase [Verrucomicrobiota bacterium]
MKLTDLRGILQYIPRFRDRVFVISLDGAVVAGENFSNLLLDIALLRSLNIRPVLVHGAAHQIQALSSATRQSPSDTDGTGITDTGTLETAIHASSMVTHAILQGLSISDLRGAASNAIIAHPRGIIQGVDQQCTGKVERVDTQLLEVLINQQIIPVIAPLGFDGEGHTFRVNSDAVALSVAKALKATKLIFITTQNGLIFEDSLICQMAVNELDQRLRDQPSAFSRETLSKAQHAAEACRWHVPRAHIINGGVVEGLLAEVFSNEGIGTLIYANAYQQVRPADKRDVSILLQMTRGSVANEELLKRTRTSIEKHITNYYLFEIDHHPIGCVALHPYAEEGVGELAFLHVNPSHENQGIGRKLIEFVEDRARKIGLDALFLLSTQAFAYFHTKAAYQEGCVDDLPPGRRQIYDRSGRNSRILVKSLT